MGHDVTIWCSQFLSLDVSQKTATVISGHLHMVSHYHLHLKHVPGSVHSTHTTLGWSSHVTKAIVHCLYYLYYRMHLHYETVFSLNV